jgi:hypothetical protein
MSTNLAIEPSVSEKQIRIRIPKSLHQEPVISRLVSDYNLTVNIAAAVLGANANGDGWFDLCLQGTLINLGAATSYLKAINVEIWRDENPGKLEITG